MQNCPVEGIISTSNGGSVTFDDLQAIQERLKGMEGRAGWIGELEGEQVLQLEALSEYTSENCPVESTKSYHDGRPMSGKEIETLADKLRSVRVEPVPAMQ